MAATNVQSKFGRHEATDAPSITFDSATTSGNVLFAFISSGVNLASLPYTAPTDWTLLVEQNGGSATDSGAIAYKVSDGTETAVTWAHSGGTTAGNGMWIVEYSGLNGSYTPVSSIIGGGYSSGHSTGTTAISGVTDAICLAFLAKPRDSHYQTSQTWSNSFTQVGDTGTSGNGGGLVIASKTIASSQTVETTFTKDAVDAGLNAVAGVVVWEIDASASITSVGGDDVVLDAEANVAFVTSGFSGEISTVQLVSGTSITTINPASINSTGGSGDFDLIDISALISPTVGAPLTTANNVVVARLTDA